jgi:hypothetical protein
MKCRERFPYNLNIEGKQRSLANRKFCLTCSPFKSYNRRDLTKLLPSGSKRENHLNQMVVAQRRRRKECMERAIAYLGGRCSVCGYSRCMRALEFHHRNPGEKSFGISSNVSNRTWEKLVEELDKCILLCANCHREEQDGLLELGSLV